MIKQMLRIKSFVRIGENAACTQIPDGYDSHPLAAIHQNKGNVSMAHVRSRLISDVESLQQNKSAAMEE